MNTYAPHYSTPPANGHYDSQQRPPSMNSNQDAYRSAPSGLSNSNGIAPHHQGNGQYPSMPPMLPMASQMNGQPSPHYYNPPPSSGPPPHEVSHGTYYNPGLPAPGPPEGTRAELAPLAPGTEPKKDTPLGTSKIHEGRKYELFVMQQPVRARMCGFGDKDRRPITPPPCVKLVITDVKTGAVVDNNDVDHGMYVITADLWHENGKDEVNMVRHSATSPAISTSMPASWNETGLPAAFSHILPQSGQFKQEPGQGNGTPSYNPYPGGPHVSYSGTQSGAQTYYQNNYPAATNGSSYSSQQNGYSQSPAQSTYNYSAQNGSNQIDYPPQGQSQQVPSNQYGSSSSRSYSQSETPSTRGPINNSAPQGMFTRNLIGSLTGSAFKLVDPYDKLGIWFVLQDMSIRTEGRFRLRFAFVNLGVPVSPTAPVAPGAMPPMVPTKTTAPVLASCFSDVFVVYSAKRFPGVVESTPLSKCFATQGIKIPIRKEGKSEKEQDYED